MPKTVPAIRTATAITAYPTGPRPSSSSVFSGPFSITTACGSESIETFLFSSSVNSLLLIMSYNTAAIARFLSASPVPTVTFSELSTESFVMSRMYLAGISPSSKASISWAAVTFSAVSIVVKTIGDNSTDSNTVELVKALPSSFSM